ncbi:MAG: DUF4174 domain-containing protein [Pseudomonadota bacterium]
MLLSLASALLSLGPALGPVPAQGLDARLTAYRWEARPILIFATADDPRLAEQLSRFSEATAALLDRDNVVIVDTTGDSAIANRFRPKGFTVILVGKDGGEKLRHTRVVAPAELNALIDTMPMRRSEMREDG